MSRRRTRAATRIGLRGRRAHGAALIVAMLVAALAAAVAISVTSGQQQWLATVANRADQVQAQSLALAGVQWARQILYEDGRTTSLDHLGEPWALPLPATPIENGSIEGAIVDAQGLFNLNNLAADGATGATDRARFERLAARAGVSAVVADALADWIDADSLARPNGAEDGWYAQQVPPTLAANAPLVRAQEAARVRGIDARAFAALAPVVTALPPGTKVNVNTAPPAVLAAIVRGLGDGALPGLIESRRGKPFTTLAEFRSRLPQGATLDDDAGLDVKSGYFLVSVRARQGEAIALVRALLQRSGGGWPAVVWQTVE